MGRSLSLKNILIFLIIFSFANTIFAAGLETQSFNYSPDQILRDAKLVAKVKWETYPSPHIISVMVEKVYWGRGDFKKGIAGWIEGKDYALDLTPHAWEKTWEAMDPKFVPLGKENILFVDSLGKLEAVGEIKGDKIILTCSTEGSKCLVGPKNEIALSSLKEIK